jgi:N-acetylgalactosamine kinase
MVSTVNYVACDMISWGGGIVMNSVSVKLAQLERWLNFVSDESRFARHMRSVYGEDETLLKERKRTYEKTLGLAVRLWGLKRKVAVVRAPGRLNLLGRHIDHRGGIVNPIALSSELIAVVAPRNDDVVCARNVEWLKYTEAQFRISESIPPRKLASISEWDRWTMAQVEEKRRRGEQTHWTDYIKGAAVMLQEHLRESDNTFKLKLKGMDLIVYGDVPPSAGLASSSALFMVASEALVALNGLKIDDEEFVKLCGYGEWYVGTRGGAGDHAAIKYSKQGYVSHIRTNPFSISYSPFPKGLKVVVFHSLEVAQKSGSARDIFNQRVACYEFGLMLMLARHPELREEVHQLSDINTSTLGSVSQIYKLILELPMTASLHSILASLPSEQHEHAFKVASTHASPKHGYPIRGVCLFGISECERSRRFIELLQCGHVSELGLLMNISHDGDRVAKMDKRGCMRKYESRCDDAHLKRLIKRCERLGGETADAELWRQPGSYRCSTVSVDFMVDVANSVDGVVGAQLSGAGLGGCMMALTREDAVERLIEEMSERYYKPRGREPCYVIATPTAGSCVISLPEG